jgi:hypothetical protein
MQCSAMFVTLKYWVAYIILKQRVVFDTVQHLEMFLTLWCQYICVTLRQWGYVHHIGTTRLCSLHWEDRVMFVTLCWHDYVHHIAMLLCLSLCDATKFNRLWQYSYVCHIAMTGICSSHWNDKAMFLTLHCYYDSQIMTILCSSYYNISMFLILKHFSKP